VPLKSFLSLSCYLDRAGWQFGGRLRSQNKERARETLGGDRSSRRLLGSPSPFPSPHLPFLLRTSEEERCFRLSR